MKKVLGIFALSIIAIGTAEGMDSGKDFTPEKLSMSKKIKLFEKRGETKFELNRDEVGKLGEDKLEPYAKKKKKDETTSRSTNKSRKRVVPDSQDEEHNLEGKGFQNDGALSPQEQAFMRAAFLSKQIDELTKEQEQQNYVMWALQGFKDCLDSLRVPENERMGNKTDEQLKSEINLTKETYKNVIDLNQYENHRKKLKEDLKKAQERFNALTKKLENKEEQLNSIEKEYGDGWKQLLND